MAGDGAATHPANRNGNDGMPQPPRHQTRKPNVLVIDNDDAVVHALATRLTSVGCICISASSGRQGIAQFTDASVDLVITDLNMPHMDGAALIAAIRRVSNVPIIVITGYHKAYHQHLRGFSGVTVLGKPFRSQDLIDLVTAELAPKDYRLSA